MIIVYFRFKISRATPFWILWRHTVAAFVSERKFFCVKQLNNRITAWSNMAAPGKLKSKSENDR